jgi:hypothetical protein
LRPYPNSFEDINYLISKESWESWTEKLYTPEDLTDENISGQSRLLDAEAYKTLQYATHRLRLSLPPGRIYGIKLTSSDYSMRLYINGEEIDSVGVPGETRETTVPRVQNRVYYFSAELGEAELVVQAANFVHAADGAWPPDFYIGSHENITTQNTVSAALAFLVVGYLLTAFFDHLEAFVKDIFRFICFAQRKPTRGNVSRPFCKSRRAGEIKHSTKQKKRCERIFYSSPAAFA